MTPANLPVVHVIREALECVLAPEVASAVFFESLNGPDGVPESKEDVILMVRSTLYAALSERVGVDQATAVVARIMTTLEPMQSGAPVRRREDDATRALPTNSRPVSVRVIAAGTGFATRLRYVLGPQRVEVDYTDRPETLLRSAPPSPALVIIDATDFPPYAPEDIIRALDGLPQACTRVIWASELPFGQRCREAYLRAGEDVLALTRAEGIEPLLDVIRSRQDRA